MGSHRAEALIYFLVSAGCCFRRPFDNMIIKYTIVQFVKKVGGHRRKYIAMRKVGPERINGTQVLIDKFGWELVLGLVYDDSQGFTQIVQGRIEGFSPLLWLNEALQT
jgi:hypothetical protein